MLQNLSEMQEMEEVEQLLKENVHADRQFDYELDMISEVSILKFDKKTKLKMLVNKRAIEIGKETNSPLYAKYKKFIDLKNKFEEALVKNLEIKL